MVYPKVLPTDRFVWIFLVARVMEDVKIARCTMKGEQCSGCAKADSVRALCVVCVGANALKLIQVTGGAIVYSDESAVGVLYCGIIICPLAPNAGMFFACL